MYTVVAYVLLVLIWSSTPLAIQLSSESLSFIAAYVFRVAIAMLLFLSVYCCMPGKMALLWAHRKLLFIGSLTIFPYLPLTYWSAQFLPSGLMSILMATAPLMFAVMTWTITKKNPFTRKTALGFFIGMCGVVCVSITQLQLSVSALWGALVLIGATAIYSYSAVKLRALTQGISLSAFDRTAGAMVFSAPSVLLCTLFVDVTPLAEMTTKSLVALIYLAVFGSILAGLFYFSVLKAWSAMSVSLVTLQTPIIALLLGYWVKNETLTPLSAIGAALVLLGVLIYLPWKVSALQKIARRYVVSKVVESSASSISEQHAIKEKMHRYR